MTTMSRPGPNKKVIIVYTDSQGLITALQKGPVRQHDAQLASIWKSIYVLHRHGAKRVVFQWIPSHCGIPRNENADAAAQQALNAYSTTMKRKVPVRYQNIVSYYKERNKAHHLSELQRKPNTRSALTTASANLSKDNSLGRRRQAKLAQLRTGISSTMGQYQRLIEDGNANHNKKCRWCGGPNETVTHVYNDVTVLTCKFKHDALRNARHLNKNWEGVQCRRISGKRPY